MQLNDDDDDDDDVYDHDRGVMIMMVMMMMMMMMMMMIMIMLIMMTMMIMIIRCTSHSLIILPPSLNILLIGEDINANVDWSKDHETRSLFRWANDR